MRINRSRRVNGSVFGRSVNSVVVGATDSAGKPVKDFSVTVDTVWEWLLAARARGELNSAHFN
jgi:hypothetical protein